MNIVMLRTELFKILSKKYLWISTLILSALFALTTLQFKNSATVQYSLQPIRQEIQQAVDDENLASMATTICRMDYTSAYQEIEPFLPASAIDYIEQYRNVYVQDTSVASLLEDRVVERICNYYQRVDDRQDEIQALRASLAEMQSNGQAHIFLYSAKAKLLAMYEENASEIELNLEHWNEFADINHAWMIPSWTMLIILLGLAGIYSDEYINKTQSVLLTSQNGRKGVFLSKLAAGAIYCLICVLYFQLFTFLVSWLTFGFPQTNISLMSLYGCKLTPFSWSALGFYLTQMVGSLLAALTMGSLIMCFSVYCKNALLPFFLAGAYYGGTFIWAKMITLPQYVTTFLSSLAELSPFTLQSITDLVSTGRLVNVFGIAVPTIYVNLVVNLLVASVSLFFCYRGYTKKQVQN